MRSVELSFDNSDVRGRTRGYANFERLWQAIEAVGESEDIDWNILSVLVFCWSDIEAPDQAGNVKE